MAGKRLEEMVDGFLRSVEPAPPLICSASTCWSGFLLERHVCHDGYAGSIIFPYTELVMVAAGSVCVEYRARRANNRFFAGSGSVSIWPAGYELRSVSWTAQPTERRATEMVRVQLDRSTLERLAPDHVSGAVAQSATQFALKDPTLASIIRLMESDVAAGCPSGKLYGESLSLALAAHMAGRYSQMRPESRRRTGLSGPVLARVLDYIRTNLGRDLTTIELAAVANISPHHFSLRFKESIGVAPHQWVVRARVREARRLLRTRSMSVAAIALALGFASQSHFTGVFRRLTGTTPKRYQQLH